MKKIINIYIFKEMVPTFTTGLILFTFLVLAGRILKLTEWMMNHGTELSQVLLIIVYTIPYVLFFTLPMATLLASLIAFSRLNEDNEIIALKSSGISFYQILPPVVTFSIISISELRSHLKKAKKGTVKHNILAIELQRKFSIPFACLLLGLIGFPLGLMMRASGRSWGIALSIVIFVVYYILLSAADSLGETGTLNPVLAMWIPNMVLGATTFVLFWRAIRDI